MEESATVELNSSPAPRPRTPVVVAHVLGVSLLLLLQSPATYLAHGFLGAWATATGTVLCAAAIIAGLAKLLLPKREQGKTAKSFMLSAWVLAALVLIGQWTVTQADKSISPSPAAALVTVEAPIKDHRPTPGQTNADKVLRPEAKALGTAAGAYIGSHEYIIAFKKTPCGYAMKEHVRSADDVRLIEIAPLVPQSALVRSYIGQEHRKWLVAAWEAVADMIKQARLEYDPNTTCGVVAGSLAGVRARAKVEWEQALAIYSSLP